MEEVEDILIDPTSLTNVPAISTPAPVVIAYVSAASEGYNILEKALFLAVVLGCVAVYIRVNHKQNKTSSEKGMA